MVDLEVQEGLFCHGLFLSLWGTKIKPQDSIPIKEVGVWIVGQRVVAPTEPELGLGTVVGCDGRTFDVAFSAAGTRRRYSMRSAPLKRLVIKTGQTARLRSGESFVVTGVQDQGGLRIYSGALGPVPESELADTIPDQGLSEKFLTGPWSLSRTYDLRVAGWQLLSRSLNPDIRGLVGARVSLLPHQLFIAHQISKREFPRVLLSDEVGLGKTIEAGLVFSSLRALDRATRVLVLAPRPLKHQWLSELYRRFNELFNVVDDDGDKLDEDLDFVSNQKNLSSIEFLLSDPRWMEMALAEPWDLLIVDEAHHLHWSETLASPEWRAVKALSERAQGLLLLTATPRQQGLETQFGLLHLVDPQRFNDFENFLEESSEWKSTATLARRLSEGDHGEDLAAEIRAAFPSDRDIVEASKDLKGVGAERLLRSLVDRHGTGRVLIRNRRERLKGFSKRQLHSVPLPSGTQDSRIDWLASFLKQLSSKEKVLLLCSTPSIARKVDAGLRKRLGIKQGLFHEGMDIVERDRQAAWFADPNGAVLLISSEIGGEGRNFQFAHNLVLYDLPKHPDLLEQRIGRLDRIGQKHPVQIYVPWFRDTEEEVYFHLYSQGMRSFERSWSGGDTLMDKLQNDLASCLDVFTRSNRSSREERDLALETLIGKTIREADFVEKLNRESVDVLMDLNSFDAKVGERLRSEIEVIDQSSFVRNYMEAIFDHYGVESEDFDSRGTLKLSAHSLTFVESFPDLAPGSEILATYDRTAALAREDLRFLTQDHPMVRGALSLLLDKDEGRVSVAAREVDETYFEFLFVLQSSAPAFLEVERFLPVTLFEIRASSSQGLRSSLRSSDAASELETVWLALSENQQLSCAQRFSEDLARWLEGATQEAESLAGEAKQDSLSVARVRLQEEQGRLEELARVNPNVRPEELKEHKKKSLAVCLAIENAQLRLDAVRLVVRSSEVYKN